MKHSIGPFTYDPATGHVEMDVGVYTLTKPLGFTLPKGKTIEGVIFRPLFDDDASSHVLENASADNVAA